MEVQKGKSKLKRGFLFRPTYHDVVWSVFAFSGLDRWEDNNTKWQPFFYEWREKDKLGLLKDIYFDTRSIYPLSGELYEVITILFMCRMIYTLVPPTEETRGFYWQKGMREKLIKEAEEKFSKEKLNFIKEMASDFAKRFKLN